MAGAAGSPQESGIRPCGGPPPSVASRSADGGESERRHLIATVEASMAACLWDLSGPDEGEAAFLGETAPRARSADVGTCRTTRAATRTRR